MKIISKYKDYYDYLVGIYGQDDKVIYDRRSPNPFHKGFALYSCVLEFFICNKKYTVFSWKNHFYQTFDELSILCKDEKFLKYFNLSPIPYVYIRGREKNTKCEFPSHWHHYDRSMEDRYNRWNCSTTVNKKERSPVLVEYFGYKIPILKDFNFPSFIPADTLYKDISAFLGWLVDNPPVETDLQTNKEKIVSHGFDLKKSFRPNMKK